MEIHYVTRNTEVMLGFGEDRSSSKTRHMNNEEIQIIVIQCLFFLASTMPHNRFNNQLTNMDVFSLP